MNFYWSKQEVLDRLDAKVTTAFHDVLKMSESKSAYMRDAAYMVAIQRVVDAMQMRGWLHGDW
jgi:glutamate dehydrogenase (NAD(P)+)